MLCTLTLLEALVLEVNVALAALTRACLICILYRVTVAALQTNRIVRPALLILRAIGADA